MLALFDVLVETHGHGFPVRLIGVGNRGRVWFTIEEQQGTLCIDVHAGCPGVYPRTNLSKPNTFYPCPLCGPAASPFKSNPEAK